MLRTEYEHMQVFVIDEVSMLTVELLADTEQRLRQIKNNDEYFGGISIILVGDFQQLPPASGETMYGGVIKELEPDFQATKLHTAYSRKLYGLFKIKYLTQFKRALDPNLLELLSTLRNLNNTKPLLDGNLIKILKSQILKPAELTGNFKNAVICVQSNQERHDINEARIRLEAKETKGVLIEWDNPITSPPALPEALESWTRERLSGQLTGRFLKGVKVSLTENVSPIAGVANGTTAFLHSLIFLDENEREIYRDKLELAKPGMALKLDKPPDFVVVKLKYELPNALRENPDFKKLRDLIPDADENENEFFVPLALKSDRFGKNNINAGTNEQIANIKFQKFEFDLAYAVTTYKLQGATLDYLIVDLNQRTIGLKAMDLRALYVMLSRLGYLNNIRILPFRNHPSKNNINPTNFLDYLKNMSQCEELHKWYDCIDMSTFLFNRDLYKQIRQKEDDLPTKKRKKVSTSNKNTVSSS